MEQESTQHHPVPAPRRLYPEIRKSEYENVTVDLINKNLNINSENIHINSLKHSNDKLPNNKVFCAEIQSSEVTPTTAIINIREAGPASVAATAPTTNNSTPTLNNNNIINIKSKSILTETNDLYGSDANENVPNVDENNAKPKPAPRPRKPQNNFNELSDNNNTNNNNNTDVYENIEFRNAEQQLPPQNTGATPKQLRKAPELPPKTYLTTERPRGERVREQRHSISSEFSTTSSCHAGASTFYNLADSEFSEGANEQRKSASNATLNSSIGESVESGESTKYKRPSPGDLFKSLGATSRLLTESIGERVAVKAKGAKHKLDKNLKTSTELLSNLSSETTRSLKHASKRFGTNFTLQKKDKTKESSTFNMTAQYDVNRPQTMPANDQVFNSISFSSPLNRTKKASAVTDLRQAVANDGALEDGAYEVPRHGAESKAVNLQPPSYEEALRTSPTPTFKRLTPSSQSVMVPKHLAMEAADIGLSKQKLNKSSSSLNQLQESSSDGNSRDSVDIPMPTFPPPALPKELSTGKSDEPVYGKLQPLQAPARVKRRKNYEDIQLRRNVDSAELQQLNQAAALAEREESMLLREQIRKAEAHAPQPDRSDSWEYFVDDAANEDTDSSSPEPLYANQEATYGNVFEMATSNRDLLPVQNGLRSICEETMEDESCTAGAVGYGWVKPSTEIIKEFDPLAARSTTTLMRTDKSNELLLLEHLLEDETYGTIKVGHARSYDDDVSMCTSEEDNVNVSGASASGSIASKPNTPESTRPQQVTVLSAPSTPISESSPSSKPMQIIHQNAQLLSESMENMLDEEARVKPYLSRVDGGNTNAAEGVDLSRPSQQRSTWFVADDKENAAAQTRVNPFNKMNFEDGECPPSYLEAIGADGKPSYAPNEQKSFSQRFMNPMNVFSNVKIRVDALKRKTSFKNGQKASSDVKVTIKMVPRPALSPLLVRHEGPLIRFPSGVVEDILKEMQNRKAILRDRQFQTFLDQEMKTPKETIPLEYITTLQCVSNSRVTDNSTHFYCFEVTVSTPKNSNGHSGSVNSLSNPNLIMTSGTTGNCKQQRVTHLYGVGKESERGVWMQKILESLTNVIPLKYIGHYYRAGWCYLKHSITSEWSGCWLLLKKSQRRLLFVSEATLNVEKMDLRKARCVVLKDSDESICNLHVESGPTLMIDCPPFTVYMIMASPRETKIWRHIIREVAHNNGFAINDQQLTKFNVPVIVDKCINFVYIHGSMSEGIYRKSGSENSILKLMSAFREDAFNVEITRNEYNEHDVANVLKRFMRDLPERLIGKLTESFVCVTELENMADKIPFYKELIGRLSSIERETLKKIVGHLAFISSQKAKNKMGVQNLTMIWGPTLLKSNSEEMVYSQKEADVLADLITLYKNLFPLTPEEVKREQEMLMCLQKYYAAAESLMDSVKKSGDLKIWITIDPQPENTKEEKNQVNITISPTKTAYDICKELAPKMGMQTHQISLHEVILNGSLERPLHHDTKIFDVVLNWSYWPEDDRKHNNLVVKPVDFLREVQRAVKNLATVTPGKELKFADKRTKSFKTLQCELRDNKIVISKKDKNEKTTIVREIFLQSTTAYLGCEKKRDFPWSWAITFVEKTQTQIMRSRDTPFIGHVLAGTEWVDRTIWYSSIWYCLFGDSILPPADLILK